MPRRRSTGSRSPEQIFGLEVRRRRVAAGISQEALAEKADLHRNYVGMVERAERSPSLGVIVQIADALGVSPAELVAVVGAAQERRKPGR